MRSIGNNLRITKIMTKKRIVLATLIILLILISAAFLRLNKTWIFYDGAGAGPIVTLQAKDAFGMTVETRFAPPNGFERVPAESGSFADYIRRAELMPEGTKITYYDGSESNGAQSAVFAFDVGNKDIQQCADMIIRVFSEYFYSNGEYDRINFHLTNGTLMKYTDWRGGKRLMAAGNFAAMIRIAGYDDSYISFRRYLECVMNYAGTISLAAESRKISLSELEIGDFLLIPGSPGHVVLVIDKAVNREGEHCFLFAQGYIPAQSFHVLVNPGSDGDMWYYESRMTEIIKTSPYTFYHDNIYRWNGWELF